MLNTSLYVGDLSEDCTEAILWEYFTKVGPVGSIRILRDVVTKKSLGYAYVNYQNYPDADRALNTLNFTEIRSDTGNKQCRISWSNRDPAQRRSAVGNVFVKGLPTTYDSRDLNDLFSVHGSITSCKIRPGQGIGCVQYETPEFADEAIAKLDKTRVDGQEISVQKFIKKSDRSDPKQTIKSVYCKHFPKEWTLADLNRKMIELGVNQEEIQSVWIKEAAADSGNFGIVTFNAHESAQRIIDANAANLHSYVQVGREGEPKKNAWFKTCLLLRKADRQRELDNENEKRRLNTMARKIYVVNLDLTATEEGVKKFFSEFGEVIKVQFSTFSPDQKHTGKCYVIFSSIESAQQALSATGRPFGTNKINVRPFKNEQMRKKQQELQQQQQRNFGYMAYGNNSMFQNQRAGAGQYRSPQVYRQGAAPYPNNQYMYPGLPQYANVPYQQQQPQPFRQQMGGPNRVPVGRMDNKMAPRGYPNNQRPPNFNRNMPYQQYNNNPNVVMNPQARNNNPNRGPMPMVNQMAQPMVMPQPAVQQQQQTFNLAQLHNLSTAEQVNLIGEELYAKISQIDAFRAGKITGMLLEMDVSELLHLLESPASLKEKIDEAINVLNEAK